MSRGRSHPGYAPWKCPEETYVDDKGYTEYRCGPNGCGWTVTSPGSGEQVTRRLRPDYFLRNPKIGALPQEGYERPRQCLIDDEDSISFSQAGAILESRWGATRDEIYLWLALEHRRLHAFSGSHEVWDEWEGHAFPLCRCKPGLSGSTRHCLDFLYACAFPRMMSASNLDASIPVLNHFRFSRAEVEEFDPADNGDDSSAEVEYLAAEIGKMGRNWFNPSGRFLSYDQAVTFLATSCSPDDAAAVVKREYDRGDLNAFSARSSVLWLHTGCDEMPPPEEALFVEGQVIALAKAEFGADIRQWDAASRSDIGSQRHIDPTGDRKEPTCPGNPGASEPQRDDVGWNEVHLTLRCNRTVQLKVGEHVKNVEFAQLGIQNKNTGQLNQSGALLVALARGKIPPRNKKNEKGISRLRALLRGTTKISADPFQKDWQPHFRIDDTRDSVEQRARRDAKHVPFDEQTHSDDEYPYDEPDPDDPAAKFLSRGGRQSGATDD